jgi:hypothetical protein
MTDASQLHWTENEEVLEQYVLGRVDPGLRVVLESHLRSCAKCRRSVESEAVLSGGIRRLGRDQLRQRLASRTRLVHARRPSWQQFAAAAVFIIAASIGGYQWWLTTQTKEQTTAPGTTVIENTQSGAGASKKEEPNRAAYAAREPLGSTGAPALETTNDRTVRTQSPPARHDAPRNHHPSFAAGEGKDETRALAGNEEFVAAPERPLPRANESSKRKMAEMPSPPESMWVLGTISPGVSTEESSANQVSQAKEDDAVRHVPASPHLAQKGQLLFLLHQRLSSTLPAAQQQLSTRPARRLLPTQIEQVGDSLTVTLYLDALYDEATLARARIRMIGSDSLAIDFPGQRIGYRLPPGWNAVRPAVAPAAK